MASGRGGARTSAGRPKGARNKLTRERAATLTELAGRYTEQALETLASIMLNDEETSASRVTAANSLLDRAHGKPIAVTPDNGEEPVSLSIKISAAAPVGDVCVTRTEG